jgi:hypothetical protein
MRIDSSGNVQIGTTAANGYNFRVAGSIPAQFVSNSTAVSNSYGAVAVYRQAKANNDGVGAAFQLNNSSDAQTEYGYIGAFITSNTTGAGGLLFCTDTARTERMRIDSSGNVGIGITNPSVPLDLSGGVLSNVNASGGSVYGLRANLHQSFVMSGTSVSNLNDVRSLGVRCYYSSGSATNSPSTYGGAFAYQHYSGSAGVGAQYITQFATAHSNTPEVYYRNSDTSNGTTFSNWYSVNLTSVSDARAKKNIVDAPSQLGILTQLEIKQFEYINENDPGVQLGMVAQQVDSVDPYYVTKNLESPDVMWRVHYDKMIPMLVKSIQELKATVDAQAARIAVLESK